MNRTSNALSRRDGTDTLIQLEHISKTYQSDHAVPHQALQDISLEIGRGEFVGIVGNSGSGKSTLMRILSCEERPTAGVYRFEGISLQDSTPQALSRLRRRKIAMIPQQYRLLRRCSAWENVAAPLSSGSFSPSDRRRRALRALRQVGLLDCADRLPGELSGGQQQRVTIARAMVCHPAMILADEPTGVLDIESREAIFQLFQQIHAAGATVLLITHDLSLAARTQRLVRIHRGHICEDRCLDNIA